MLIEMKIARIKKGFTQQDLANIVGSSVSTIRNIESKLANIKNAKYGTVSKVANTLDISVEKLIKESEEG